MTTTQRIKFLENVLKAFSLIRIDAIDIDIV